MTNLPIRSYTPYEDETGRLITTWYENDEVHIHAELYKEVTKRNYLHWLGVLQDELEFLKDTGETEVYTISYNEPDKINFAVMFGFLPEGEYLLDTGVTAIKMKRTL